MVEIKPPSTYSLRGGYKMFLAGSIEMGTAVDWQQEVARSLEHIDDLFIFNPRRDEWDASWVQSIENEQFNAQVNWELKALEDADLIVYYFAPGTQSPISLLELGLYANSGKMIIVCCPDGFWRKGNVDIVCDRYSVPTYSSLDTMTKELMRYVPIWVEGFRTKQLSQQRG